MLRAVCLRWRMKSTTGNYLALISLAMTLLCMLTLGYSSRWYDDRCLEEIIRVKQQQLIQNGTKADLVRQFLKVYDVNIENMNLQDPGTLADNWMNCIQVHPDNDPNLGAVLHWLSFAPITKSVSGIGGNSRRDIYNGHTAKFQFTLQGGQKALFKVKAYEREKLAGDLSKWRLGADRHNGEIASYHLQRILGFNRAPIAVGRKVSITDEILPVADDSISTHLSNRDGETCIEQTGINYKLIPFQKITKTNYLCGKDGVFEGTLMLWLPREYRTVPFYSPVSHKWNVDYLEDGLTYPLENNVGKLMDYIDILLFDYLIQNPDRNAFHFDPSTYSSLLIVDNGKSFGDPFYDWKNMLHAFTARCQVRSRTYTRLKQLSGGVVSTVLRQILSRDPIAPVLWERHYEALDRRLSDILDTIKQCISKHGIHYVIIDDFDIKDSRTGKVTFSYIFSLIRSFLKV